MEIKGVNRLFNLETSVDIERPVGEVDILVGIHEAELYPITVARIGNLRLLSSIFRSGYLLEESLKSVITETTLKTVEVHMVHRGSFLLPDLRDEQCSRSSTRGQGIYSAELYGYGPRKCAHLGTLSFGGNNVK